MDSLPSKYKIEDKPSGFLIYAEGRKPTWVQFNGYGFSVSDDDTPIKHFWPYAITGIFEFRKMLGSIANNLMSTWQRPEAYAGKRGEWSISAWAKKRTAMALAKRVKEKWIGLYTKAEPIVVDIQRNAFSAGCKVCDQLKNPKLYQCDKYLLNDFAKYKAAARCISHFSIDTEPNGKFMASPYGDDRHPLEFYGHSISHYNNWMDLYTGRNPATRALRKTLMNLPGGVPINMLFDIKQRMPTYPLLTRLELLTYLHLCGRLYEEEKDSRFKVLERSSADDIRKALRITYEYLRESDISLRKSATIFAGLQHIFDCTEAHNGNIVGLAHKSVRWHRERRYLNASRYNNLPVDTLVKVPPIALPEVEGVKFLSTVKDIYDEGDSMGHCISSYADRAVRGSCFLFHIDFKKECASIEVDVNGSIVQAQGPHNRPNKAVNYARKVLGKWGKNFPISSVKRNDSVDIYEAVPF